MQSHLLADTCGLVNERLTKTSFPICYSSSWFCVIGASLSNLGCKQDPHRTPFRCRVHSHPHTHSDSDNEAIPATDTCHVGMWEETRDPGEDPCRQGETVQTPQTVASGQQELIFFHQCNNKMWVNKQHYLRTCCALEESATDNELKTNCHRCLDFSERTRKKLNSTSSAIGLVLCLHLCYCQLYSPVA